MTRIAEGLADDFDVHVLCSQPTYSARGLRASSREVHNGVLVRRCLSVTLDRTRHIYRALNAMTIACSIWLAAVVSVRRTDYLLVVTNPPLLPLVAATVARLRRAPMMLLVHDVYPDALTASGLISRTGFPARLLRRLSRWIYNSAERTIVLGRDMKRLVETSMRVPSDRIAIIPNWSDADMVRPTSRGENVLLRELKLTEKFVIQYAGNMGYTHGLECLLSAIADLQSDETLHFLLIGSGSRKLWLETQARALGLPNITLLEHRPRTDQQNFLNACDIAIITFARGMAGVSVPSRMYNILAAGKAIIAVADHQSELAMLVEDEQLGWVVTPGDASGIVHAVNSARQQPSLLADMGRRARVVAERYSLSSAVTAYHTLMVDMRQSMTITTKVCSEPH